MRNRVVEMEYITLTQEEKDDTIVSFLHQQEIDHFCHSINSKRYEKILNDEDIIDSEFKKNIQKLKYEVEIRIFEVEKIIEHSKEQLPPPERIKASIDRTFKTNKPINK